MESGLEFSFLEANLDGQVIRTMPDSLNDGQQTIFRVGMQRTGELDLPGLFER